MIGSERKKEDVAKFTKLKIACGYLIILLLAVITMFFVLNNLGDYSSLGVKDSETKEKLNYLNATFFHLYEAEGLIGETLVNPVMMEEYSSKTEQIKTKIDTLKKLFYDDSQVLLLDSLEMLLDIKEANVRSLALLATNTSIDKIYRNNLYKAIAENDSLYNNRVVEEVTTVKNDTVTYKRPSTKKNTFFKRFFGIFSSKEIIDTTIEVRKSESKMKDTVVSFYNPADTINHIFENLKARVYKEKAHIDKNLSKKLSELQMNNRAINVQMNSILQSLQDEDMQILMDSIQIRSDSMARISSYLRYIAVVAVALIFIFIFMLFRDISRSRKYRRDLEEANRTTTKMMENREKLMLGITHDIKAPLGSIIGYIELLNDNKLSTKQNYYLDNMKTSSEHILHLVTDILDFNRLDAGMVELNPLPFNCKNLFNEVVDSFRPQAEKRKLTLDFSYDNKLNTDMLVGDPLRIRQIVNNLMSNALKFTVKGSVGLYVFVSPDEANEGKCHLKFKVVDTGSGISQEDQNVIFQEYTRVGKKSGGQTEGFGLGLSIVNKLIKMYHGDLNLESQPGEGSIFTVSLPLNVVLSEENNPQPVLNPLNGNVPKVLVIDDDPSQLTMISEQMKSRGLLCTTCDNPYSALEIIEKNSFDIIFSDIQMPGFNGFEIVKRIRNAHFSNAKTIPVIALSARADISITQFKKHGFTSFLNKPFSNDQLFDLISRYVNTENCVPKKSKKNKSSEVVDGRFQKVLSFAGGDKNSEYEILSSFVKETKKNIEELNRLLKRSDITGINKLSHKMLAIFKMLGDDSLIEWLSSLEKMESMDFLDRSICETRINQIRSIVEEGEKEMAARE
ncbi:MAG TPA: hybrid sensor histidine kinase/response regulator [Paludibacteraceae bacterium]|nr:hybrid sensor histidine kinase/response regulator [Paludibacteraceae bacterium]HQF49251.1 hybrid sensor histidine kinase/response regulator [Paludibacteraceae bacterium]